MGFCGKSIMQNKQTQINYFNYKTTKPYNYTVLVCKNGMINDLNFIKRIKLFFMPNPDKKDIFPYNIQWKILNKFYY